MMPILKTRYSPEQIQACIELLEYFVKNGEELICLSTEQKIALIAAAGLVSRPDRDEVLKRRINKAKLKRQVIDRHERRVRAATGIRSARQAEVFKAPERIAANGHNQISVLKLINPRACYVCKEEF